jgi:Protein of unknown function (DUF5818)
MKSLLLTLALLLGTALLAQQESQSPTPTDRPLTQQTVQGCLQGGDHQFTLTESGGTVYQLEGDGAKLRKHVGHEIQVDGTIGKSAASSSASPPKDSPQTIQVVDVKHLSSTCKSSK